LCASEQFKGIRTVGMLIRLLFQVLTVVAHAQPRLISACRNSCIPGSWYGVEGAAAAEDASADAAVVAPHKHAEWRFTFIAGLALGIIYPVVLALLCNLVACMLSGGICVQAFKVAGDCCSATKGM
jgi:hypothetical protein